MSFTINVSLDDTIEELSAFDIPDEHPDLEERHVLIVEDHPLQRDVLQRTLSGWAMNAHTVASGLEALRWMDQGRPCDAILIDQHMPRMDGVTLARALHAQWPDTPLILLSTHAPPDHGRAFSATLPKPLQHDRLQQTLEDLLSTTSPEHSDMNSTTGTASHSDLGSERPLSILMAEDNVVNQKVGLRMLARMGYTADVVPNGALAVSAMQKSPYDVILMDMQMPEMDGLEATRVIRRELPDAQQPIIIAVTANAMRGDKERCLEAGMDHYLSKPVKLEQLAEKLIIAANALAERSPSSSSQSSDLSDPMMETIRTQLRELAGGDDTEFIAEILNDYLEVAPSLVHDLREAIAAQNADAARNAAHSLKSSSGAIGADAIQVLCGELEALARTGTLEGALEHMKAIEAQFETLEAMIRKEVATMA